MWVDNPAQVVNPMEGGQTLVAPDANGVITRAKIKLLTQNPNALQQVTDASLRHICLHESGHALGLLGHSSQPGDIMFSTVNYSTPLSGLSDRDKKTMLELYSAPDSFMAAHQMNTTEGALIGSDTNPTNHAVRLNNDGFKELRAGHFAQALKMFEDAVKIDPDCDSAKQNIGVCYADMGKADYEAGRLAAAEKNLNLAVAAFQKSGRKDLGGYFQNLSIIARAQGHEADALKYEAQEKNYSK
jgi:tetratricopeptide (TPR) repeat protein